MTGQFRLNPLHGSTGSMMRGLLAFLMLTFLLPVAQAHAGMCDNMYDENSNAGLTASITQCIENEFSQKASALRTSLAGYLGGYMQGCLAIAIVMFGLRMSGNGARYAEAIGFLTRIMVAVLLFYDGGGIVSGMTSWPREFMTMAGVGAPWNDIDTFLGKTLGVGAGLSIASGMIGLLSGALFSSTFGMILFFAGIKTTLDIVFFIVQCVFVYLSAVTMVAFLVVVSPIILPFALFYYTEKYALAWGNIIAACVLTPMMLFTCLNAFIELFSETITEMFELIVPGGQPTPTSFDSFWRADMPAFSWLLPGDANFNQDLENMNGISTQAPAVQSNVNPLLRLGVDAGVLKHAGLTFGMNTVGIIQQIVMKFGELILLTYVVKSLIDQIPVIASQITGGATGIKMMPTQMEGFIKSQVNKAQNHVQGGKN